LCERALLETTSNGATHELIIYGFGLLAMGGLKATSTRS
jgi:hypothetical protein